MPEVDLGGVTIAYDVTGQGPGEAVTFDGPGPGPRPEDRDARADPVLLVAGCGQPAMAWHLGLVPALVAAGHRVITFDNRGVEPSSSPPAPYSVPQMAADALGLLDHLGLERVLAAGHSMGGWILETLAEQRPDRIRAMALMGSANVPTAWERAVTTVERDLARDYPDLPPLYYAVETLRYLPTAELQDDGVVGSWLELIGDIPPWPNPGRLGQYEACLGWSTRAGRDRAWSTLRVPCLVMAFEHDTDSPPALAREAAATIPGARYVEVAGAGHLGVITHAEKVAEALVDFFAPFARGLTSRPSPPG